jgi:hypothetical protein
MQLGSVTKKPRTQLNPVMKKPRTQFDPENDFGTQLGTAGLYYINFFNIYQFSRCMSTFTVIGDCQHSPIADIHSNIYNEKNVREKAIHTIHEIQ